jgi:PAS domain-containing protein
MPLEYFDLFRSRLLRCVKGEQVSYESWLDTPSDGMRLMRVNLYPYHGADAARGVIFIADDVTDLKITQHSLEASEYRYREMFEHIGSGVLICDAIEDGADFLIQAINPSAHRIIQREEEVIAGEIISDVMPGFLQNGMMEVMCQVWRNGIPAHLPEIQYEDQRLSRWFENYIS